MAGTITVMANQSMMDVVLQATGSLEAAIQFCQDNNVALSDIPVSGTLYTVSDAALAMGNSSVLAYLAKYDLQIGTLGGAAPVFVQVMTDESGNTMKDEYGNTMVME